MLRSYPLLEEFEIQGKFEGIQNLYYCDGGELSFDFSHLKYLKSIKIDGSGHSYYELNVPGKRAHRWLDLDNRCHEWWDADSDDSSSNFDNDINEDAIEPKFYISLSWSEENKPSIFLHEAIDRLPEDYRMCPDPLEYVYADMDMRGEPW